MSQGENEREMSHKRGKRNERVKGKKKEREIPRHSLCASLGFSLSPLCHSFLVPLAVLVESVPNLSLSLSLSLSFSFSSLFLSSSFLSLLSSSLYSFLSSALLLSLLLLVSGS